MGEVLDSWWALGVGKPGSHRQTCKDTQVGQGKGTQLSLPTCPPHTVWLELIVLTGKPACRAHQTEHVHRQPTFAQSHHTCLGQQAELPFTSQAAGAREDTFQAGLGPLLVGGALPLPPSPSEGLPQEGVGRWPEPSISPL